MSNVPVLVALDANGTIARGRLTARLVSFLGLDGDAYQQAWRAELERVPEYANPGSEYRAAKTRHVNEWIARERGVPLRRSELERFAAKNELFPGVIRTLQTVRTNARRNGIDVRFVLITNSWADAYRATGLVTARPRLMEAKDVYGQKLAWAVDGSLIGPDGTVSATSKPDALEAAMLAAGVEFGHVIVVADGYTDRPMFVRNHRLGGSNIGIRHSIVLPDDKYGAVDLVRMDEFSESGLVEVVVEGDWRLPDVGIAIVGQIEAVVRNGLGPIQAVEGPLAR